MDLPTCWWLKNLNLADQDPCVAALKLRGERKKVGFLDLAAEIRLQIYEHLLLNCTADGKLHAVQVVDSLQRRLDGYAPYVRYNEGDGQGLVPAKGPRNSAGNIHAAILQTCRQIAEEGSHFLYGNNVFAVNLSRESYAPKYRFFRENDKHLMQPIANLFRMKDIPCYLSELSYVAFIKQIGLQNTVAIRHMQIYGNNTEEYSMAMPILTEIIKRYLTSLLTAIFFLVANTNDSRSYERREYERYINRTQPSLTADEDYDTRPLDFSFDPDNPTRATGAFRPLYIALDDFSKKVTSLQWLEYRGHWHFMQQDFLGIGFDCRWAMMITDRIEEYVRYSGLGKRRAAGVLKEIFLDPLTSPSIMRARSAINGRLHRWRDYEEEEFALINGRGLRPCGRSLVDDLS